jgi:multidrug efflux pump
MMCSKMLHHVERHGLLYRTIESGIVLVTRGYRRALAATLQARWLVVLAGLLVAGSSFFLFTTLKSELAPTEDRGTIVGIGIAPEGSTLDFTDHYARQIEALYQQVPEIVQYFVVTGFPVVSQVISFTRLVDWEERARSQQEVAAELAPRMFGIPGILAFAVNPPSLGQNPVEKPVQFVIQTSQPYEELQRLVDSLLAAARDYPGMVNLDTDLKLNKPELKVDLDREKVANVGLEVDTVGRTLETMLGGRQVTRFKQGGKQYDVIVQVADIDRQNPDDLASIYVRNHDGVMIPMNNIISVTERVAPKELNHFNKLRSATITATIAPGYTLGDALTFMQETAARVLPPSAQTDLAGQSREFKESSTSLYVTFLLALAFIYLVLSAQFESFIDPLIIMLTVPLSLTGALIALHLTGGTLNVYSQIGLITLVGLITKHGILIVEFSNQLQAQGRSKLDAVIEAAGLRLRPILMTTGAMVLGAVPLAIATGAGAESRSQIGWVIVGGISFGTVFTLFVVPTAYTLLARSRGPAAAARPTAEPTPIQQAAE